MHSKGKARPKPGTPQALGELDHRIIATVREPCIVLDGDLRIIFLNDSFYRTFKVLRRGLEGRFIFEIGNRQWDIPRLRILLENILLTDQCFQDFVVEHDFPKIGRRTMLLQRPASNGGGKTGDLILLAIEDVTERKQQEFERQRLLAEQQVLAEELATANEELQVQAEELTVQQEGLTVRQEELGRLNADLRSQQRLLEAANEEMESFSYSISQDLKTPLRAIQGFTRMLRAEHADKLDEEALGLLKVITDNTKLMYSLIDDLLALSRLECLQIKKSVVNLTAVTMQIFAQFQAEALERDLRLKLDDLPQALSDQSLLYQVMQNLLANAVKFTKSRETAVIEVGGGPRAKRTFTTSRTTALGLMRVIPPTCSTPANACMAVMNTKAPGWVWP